jgi:hypothetical protein
MLPERCIRRHVLGRAIVGVRRRPSVWRQLSGFEGVFDSAKPFLVHFHEETRKAPFCFLPGRLRNLEPAAGGRLDLGRDDHIDGNPMNQPPLDQPRLLLIISIQFCRAPGSAKVRDFKGELSQIHRLTARSNPVVKGSLGRADL